MQKRILISIGTILVGVLVLGGLSIIVSSNIFLTGIFLVVIGAGFLGICILGEAAHRRGKFARTEAQQQTIFIPFLIAIVTLASGALILWQTLTLR